MKEGVLQAQKLFECKIINQIKGEGYRIMWSQNLKICVGFACRIEFGQTDFGT